jgi:hypothetical protein
MNIKFNGDMDKVRVSASCGGSEPCKAGCSTHPRSTDDHIRDTTNMVERSTDELPEEKLAKAFPKLAEGMLGHCFKTDMGPDEDGSELIGYAMPLGWVIAWMKIVEKKAEARGFERGRAVERKKIAKDILDIQGRGFSDRGILQGFYDWANGALAQIEEEKV